MIEISPLIFYFFLFCHKALSVDISFFHFKTFQIHSHDVSPLHHVLVRKIHIYMPEITFSNLLKTYPNAYLFSKKSLLTFCTCFVSNLIPIWPGFHGLFNGSRTKSYFYLPSDIQQAHRTPKQNNKSHFS